MSRLNELQERRNAAIAAARAVLDEAGNAALTPEAEARYSALDKDIDAAGAAYDREARLVEVERDAARTAAPPAGPEGAGPKTGDAPAGEAENRARRQMEGLRGILRSGRITDPDAEREFRALQVDSNAEGGYLTTPVEFATSLIEAVRDQVFIRQAATVQSLTSAVSLGVPSLDTRFGDADWTSELGTGNEDTAMRFGRRELTPHPLAKRIKISNELLRLGSLPVEALVRDQLAYKFAISQEKAFLTGNGVNQPLGVFTASADGISTGRDVSTGNSTTAIGVDGLIEAKYALKGAYWPRATWMFHRDALKSIAKLKDSAGQYIWQPGLVAGTPDRLLNMPISMSEYVPNTFTTGLYVGILGDFSNYWIADSMQLQIQRLAELYAETNQVGFIGRLQTDGMPVLEEAFARVTLA